MAHSHHEHREHVAGRKRVGSIMKGSPMKAGASYDAATAEKKVMQGFRPAAESKSPGKSSSGRLDKYARGGRTKGKKKSGNHVNIAIVNPAPKGDAAGPVGSPALGGGAGGPPPLPPKMPAMGGPPGLPPGGAPMLPPGLKPPGVMARGGKVKGQKGGAETGQGRLDKRKMYKARG